MGDGTITGTVTQTVILGSGAYPDSLLVASTGDVVPGQAGRPGVLVRSGVAGAKIDNEGRISGAAGAATGGKGGVGVDLRAAGHVTNSGTILGGEAGQSTNGPNPDTGFQGGLGVNLSAGGLIANSGSIRGGAGSYGYKTGGTGGTGLRVDGGQLENHGSIIGGGAGQSGTEGSGGMGGLGALLSHASQGTNSGTIMGGNGQYEGGVGGTGVQLSHSVLSNTGSILGGYGGFGYFSETGVGGVGVNLGPGSVLRDAGQVTGGHGAYNHFYGSDGGVGVVVSSAQLIVSGTVTGGRGGAGSESAGGTGGTGVVLSGGQVDLTGTIIGGAAGPDASGGDGVYINGGTVIDNGTISGAPSGGSNYAHAGDAILFGGNAGRLILGTQAVLQGDVVATAGAGDALILAAHGQGTLSGLGTTVVGFDTITVDKGGDWTLAGNSSLLGQEHVADHGSLTLAANVSGTGTLTLDNGAVLTAVAGVTGVGVAFNGGAMLVLDNVASVSSTLSGFGNRDTIDLAKLSVTTVTYTGGTLTLQDGSAAVGSLAFSGTYTQDNFSVGSDGQGGSVISYTPAYASSILDELVNKDSSGNVRPDIHYSGLATPSLDKTAMLDVLHAWSR